MSIASEITSMGENLKKDYQSIANLGADLTNVDKNIENIAELLDGVYDVLPKTSFQEGTSVTIEGGLKGKIDFDDGKVGFGQASQYTTTGIQLLNIPDIVETTKNGITYSCTNGILKLNGTATAGFEIWLIGTSTSGSLLVESGNYTFAGQVVSGSRTSGVCGKYVRNTAGSNNIIDGNQIETYTQRNLTDNYSNCSVYLFISSGTVLSNLVVGLSLVKGLYTQSTMPPFEQYSGGYVSPSPNWKQNVKYVAGRNKADPSKLNLGKTLSNTGALIDLHNRTTSFQNQVEPNTSYALSVNNGYQIGNLFYYDKNKNYSSSVESAWANSKVITIPNNAYYVSFATARTDNATMTESDVEALHLQIEQGTEAHPYLPYNTIEIVESGKNLLEGIEYGDIDPQSGVLYNSNTAARSTNYIPYDTSKTYYVSVNSVLPTSQGLNLRFYNKSKEYIGYSTLIGSGSNFTITKGNQVTTTDLEPKYFKFRQTLSTGPITSLNDKVMIATISGATYEPYITPQTYQFSLGNNKFYSIGDYADELLYDVENDKVYKNEKIKGIILNGTENWNAVSSAMPNTSRFFFNSEDVYNPRTSWTSEKDVFSNMFKPMTWNEIYGDDTTTANGISNYSSTDTQMGRIVIRISNDIATSSTFITWLENNRPEVCYVKATPTLTEITDTTLKAQVKALYNAQSFNGTTIIESNGDLPMIIKVRALKGE